jgi:hypothetical protein
MTTCGYTSIVYNNPNKLYYLDPFYYRYRKCNTNLTGNTPADQYQKLKLIQNTVRVYGSLYTANLGPLNAYAQPPTGRLVTTNTGTRVVGGYGVCWNQMSDRPVPSVQRVTVPTGNNNSLNRRHTSVTSSKPGSQTPGGIGCDIKHNSYDRYLNRLKGKGPLRRGVIPPTFGLPIPFNRAYPVYGGKTTKTNIVTGCNCPITASSLQQNIQIYNNPFWQPYPSGNCQFQVNQKVYYTKLISSTPPNNTYYTTATITNNNNNGTYNIRLVDGRQLTVPITDLMIYFPCNCTPNVPNSEKYYILNPRNSIIPCTVQLQPNLALSTGSNISNPPVVNNT